MEPRVDTKLRLPKTIRSIKHIEYDGEAHKKMPAMKILLLDDDKICRLTTEILLKHCQHKVTSVRSVEEALDVLNQEKNFDLILSDCQMPGEPQDGLDFAKTLHDDPERFFPTPLVMMSATTQADEMKQKALSLGALQFFRKPLSLSDAFSLNLYVDETETKLHEPSCPRTTTQEFREEIRTRKKRSKEELEFENIDDTISFLRNVKQKLISSRDQKKDELEAWRSWVDRLEGSRIVPEACLGLEDASQSSETCERFKNFLIDRDLLSHDPSCSCSATKPGDCKKKLDFWANDSQSMQQLDSIMMTLKPAQLKRRLNTSLIASSKLVSSLAFVRDEKQQFCATGGSDMKVRIFCTEKVLTGSAIPHQIIPLKSKVSSLSWAPNDQRIAAATHDGTVAILAAGQGKVKTEWNASKMCIRTIDWVCSNRIISGGDDGVVKLWDTNRGCSKLIWKNSVGAAVCSMRVCPTNCNLIACGSSDSRIRIWDIRTKEHPIVDFKGHEASISSVQWGSDGSSLVSSATDSTVKKWSHLFSESSREKCHTYRGHLARRNFTGLGISSSGLIACGSETNEVVVYAASMSRPWLRTHFIDHGMPSKDDNAALKNPIRCAGNDMVKQLTSARTFLNRDGLFVSCLAWRGNSIWAVSSSGRLQVFDVEMN